jgi:Skp family chaperone for outer membrane proteins
MRTTLIATFSAVIASVLVTVGLNALGGGAPSWRLDAAAVADDAKPVDLGPADSVVIAGKVPVKLTNVDGHVSFGDGASHRIYSIGTVNVSKGVRALMESARFSAERDRLTEERTAKEEEFEKRAKDLRERITKAGDDEDADPKLREDIESFQQDVGEWGESHEKAQRDLIATQYEAAYGDLREAVEVVADRRKLDIVMRFVPSSEKLEPGTPEDIARQLLARTFVRIPEALDITDEVMRELNVTEVKEKEEG